MGILGDIFSEKVNIWEEENEELYERNCKLLRDAGFKIQAFKVNKRPEGCSGNCFKCVAQCAGKGKQEEIPTYEKIGSGITTDMFGDSDSPDRYAIYVKKSEMQQALKIISA